MERIQTKIAVRVKQKTRRVNRIHLRERQRSYYKAFTAVFACYEESQVTSGVQSYDRFYRRLAGEQSDSTGGMCVGAGISDFLSDVELAIKEVLGREYYTKDFKSAADFTDAEKEQIGKEFMVRKLFPVVLYFKPKSRQ